MQKALRILSFFLFFILTFSTIVGWRWWHVKNAKNVTFQSQSSSFQLNPPKRALTGRIKEVIGDVEKQTRNTEEVVEAENDMLIQEGEQLITHEKSTVVLSLGDDFIISLLPETTLAFSSTDPTHFLFKQDKGTASYQSSQINPSFSVRSLHALLQTNQGKTTVTTQPTEQQMTAVILEGNGVIGYIDAENNTQIREISAGQTLIYTDAERELQIR